jgi:hypothetical protein
MADDEIEQLQDDLAALALVVREGFAEMRGGFAEMRGGFADVNRRLDDLTDVTHRIYEEHGERLKDLEAHLTRQPRP